MLVVLRCVYYNIREEALPLPFSNNLGTCTNRYTWPLRRGEFTDVALVLLATFRGATGLEALGSQELRSA